MRKQELNELVELLEETMKWMEHLVEDIHEQDHVLQRQVHHDVVIALDEAIARLKEMRE